LAISAISAGGKSKAVRAGLPLRTERGGPGALPRRFVGPGDPDRGQRLEGSGRVGADGAGQREAIGEAAHRTPVRPLPCLHEQRQRQQARLAIPQPGLGIRLRRRQCRGL
jgi:hypothetical protein